MKARRFLALVVTALMLLTSLALPSSLGGVQEAEALSVSYADASTLASPEAAEVAVPREEPLAKDYYEGWCGDNLYWEFYSYSGELIITGSGAMYAFGEDYSPWAEEGIEDQIKSVSLPKKLTSIGACAFYGCTALTSITIPDGVKYIGTSAFENCYSLASITLPKSVNRIDQYAFYGCSNLKHVYYGGTMEQRAKIVIYDGSYYLQNVATWHYTKNSTTALAIKTQPKNVKVNEGKIATFKVKAAGASTITWQYRAPGESTWYSVGYTGESYSIMGSTLYDGYSFRCKVTNGSSTIYSSPATLTVKQVKLAMKTQPKTIKTAQGKNVTFKVKTAGATNIVWQAKWRTDTTWYDVAYNTETYTVYYADPYDDDLSVRCVISNDRGNTIYSNTAKLYLKLSLKTQPKNATANEGELAMFSVTASGASSYQWEYMYPNGHWVTWSGVTDSCFYISGKPAYDGLSFRCKVSNASGYIYSKAAKLTVKSGTHYRALLIGESDYSSKPLAGGAYNVSSMEGMLKGLNNSFTVTTLKNASRSQIMNGISTAFAGSTDKDVSLFYYSGHGLGSSYTYSLGALCPISGSYIYMTELASALSNVKGRVIVILDSCHSGAAIGKGDGEVSEDMLDAFNQSVIDAFMGAATEKYGDMATSKYVVLTAAAADEVGWAINGYSGFDGNGYPQHAFTAALIKAMGCKYPNGAYNGSMPADKNGDKLITLKELYNYSYDQCVTWNRQYNTSSIQHVQYYGDLSEVLFRRK